MAPGSSPERAKDAERLLARHGGTLLRIALASIEHGLAHARPLSVDPADYMPTLRAERASFVTLTLDGKLRGCVGKAMACRPLVNDVAENAYAAAFEDDRFDALTQADADGVDVEISVLSDPVPISFSGEADLLDKLRPGVDGVILECNARRGLFLPDVWETVPDAREFLAHLKVKAGLAADHWSNDIAAYRFTTVSTSLSGRGAAV
ncbi:MAG: AmmeMemoRadiSam system protein A [Alphaproteobacteria bacterium]